MQRTIRLVGGALLVAGLGLLWSAHPTLPGAPPWSAVERFRLDPEECRELRDSRQTTRFTLPEGAETTTIAEVARRFGIEPRLVCGENDLDPDCGTSRVEPADELLLPLHPGSGPAAAPPP